MNSDLFWKSFKYIKKEHYSKFCTFEIASLLNVFGHYLSKYGMWWCSAMQRAKIFLGTLSMVQTVCMPAAVYIACHRNLLLTKVLCWQHYTTSTHFSWQSTCVTYIWIWAMTVVETQYISSYFLLVVNLEIDSITDKPYIPQKSWFQWICSKFFVLCQGHNYFWPPWLWRLLEAKNVIAGAHFGTQLNVPIIPQCHFCLPKEIKSNPNVHQ